MGPGERWVALALVVGVALTLMREVRGWWRASCELRGIGMLEAHAARPLTSGVGWIAGKVRPLPYASLPEVRVHERARATDDLGKAVRVWTEVSRDVDRSAFELVTERGEAIRVEPPAAVVLRGPLTAYEGTGELRTRRSGPREGERVLVRGRLASAGAWSLVGDDDGGMEIVYEPLALRPERRRAAHGQAALIVGAGLAVSIAWAAVLASHHDHRVLVAFLLPPVVALPLAILRRRELRAWYERSRLSTVEPTPTARAAVRTTVAVDVEPDVDRILARMAALDPTLDPRAWREYQGLPRRVVADERGMYWTIGDAKVSARTLDDLYFWIANEVASEHVEQRIAAMQLTPKDRIDFRQKHTRALLHAARPEWETRPRGGVTSSAAALKRAARRRGPLLDLPPIPAPDDAAAEGRAIERIVTDVVRLSSGESAYHADKWRVKADGELYVEVKDGEYELRYNGRDGNRLEERYPTREAIVRALLSYVLERLDDLDRLEELYARVRPAWLD